MGQDLFPPSGLHDQQLGGVRDVKVFCSVTFGSSFLCVVIHLVVVLRHNDSQCSTWRPVVASLTAKMRSTDSLIPELLTILYVLHQQIEFAQLLKNCRYLNLFLLDNKLNSMHNLIFIARNALCESIENGRLSIGLILFVNNYILFFKNYCVLMFLMWTLISLANELEEIQINQKRKLSGGVVPYLSLQTKTVGID